MPQVYGSLDTIHEITRFCSITCPFICFFFTNLLGLDNYSTHTRPELTSFDDIDYENFAQVSDARKSMLREQWIRTYSLRVTHEALRKCKTYHQVDAQKNCRPLILKYMKMLEDYPMQGYMGYQKNDPSQ